MFSGIFQYFKVRTPVSWIGIDIQDIGIDIQDIRIDIQ